MINNIDHMPINLQQDSQLNYTLLVAMEVLALMTTTPQIAVLQHPTP
jgi:hypothetical protein